MRKHLSAFILAAGLAVALPAASATALKTAVFAGGCFWSMEHDMEPIPGVTKVVSGYTGGPLKNPTYQDVVTETTGHYESVKVTYDPAKISYPQLVAKYLRVTDPTDSGGAFCDRGESYRPAIFVADAAERQAAQAAIAAAQPLLKKKIVTPVLPAATFYPAEEYHQDYAARNSLRYGVYRRGCGKDRVIKAVWRGR